MMLAAIDSAHPLLPDGYTQTEFTQSHSVGTFNGASIFTNIKPSTDLVVECEAEFVSFFSGAPNFIFGSDPSDRYRYAAYVNPSNKWGLGWDNGTISTAVAEAGVKYTIKVAAGKLWIDGVVVAETSNNNVNTNCGITLYSYNYSANGNLPSRYSNAKLYWIKFTRGGVVVGYFISCTRDSDSASGMYDIVTNKFFPCESLRGKGNYFVAGPTVPPETIYHKFATGLHKCKAILPDKEYRNALYVKSSRASYINTGYVPKTNTEMEIRLKFGGTFQYGTGNVNAFFGTTDTDGRTYTTNFGNSSGQQNQLYTWLSRTYDGSHIWQLTINDSTRTNINTLTYTPTKVTYGSYSKTPQLKTEDNSTPITIMGRRKANGDIEAFTAFEMYVYEWIIREGSAEVRHYIPKKRIADGVYGLYDTINNTFHPSDSNTPFEGEEAS